jgi:hypothetical protein
MNKSNLKTALTTDQLLYLLEIYEYEWQHRNNLLWSQVFKLFYMSLIIMALPILSGSLGFNMPMVPSIIFPVTGALASVFSYYMSMSYSIRLRASRKTIDRLIAKLPEEYRITRLSELHNGKYFTAQQTKVIPTAIFMVEMVVAIVLIYCIRNGLLLPA